METEIRIIIELKIYQRVEVHSGVGSHVNHVKQAGDVHIKNRMDNICLTINERWQEEPSLIGGKFLTHYTTLNNIQRIANIQSRFSNNGEYNMEKALLLFPVFAPLSVCQTHLKMQEHTTTYGYMTGWECKVGSLSSICC